jgi:hypothetical protein
MRLEFGIEVTRIEIPRFAVEAVEGIGKLFSLAVLVLNVLDTHEKVEIVFHGLNPEDPERKIAGFRQILESSSDEKALRFESGNEGRVSGSSSSFQWLTVSRD